MGYYFGSTRNHEDKDRILETSYTGVFSNWSRVRPYPFVDCRPVTRRDSNSTGVQRGGRCSSPRVSDGTKSTLEKPGPGTFTVSRSDPEPVETYSGNKWEGGVHPYMFQVGGYGSRDSRLRVRKEEA